MATTNFDQDEDYQVCDQCKETIYGEWVCYCWECENNREQIISLVTELGRLHRVWEDQRSRKEHINSRVYHEFNDILKQLLLLADKAKEKQDG